MEIVIKISEDVYTRLFDNGIQDNEIAVDDVCEMARAIRLGTPIEAPSTDKCKGCYYNDGDAHAECVVCDKEAQPTDMTLDEAIEDCEENDYGQIADLLRELKAYKETQPTDAVSRQAVIEHICEAKECYKEECKGRTLKRCPDLQWVLDLPSVTPLRPKGKWIVISCEPTDIFKCSECGMRVINPYRYCHSCGAKMSGGGEDEKEA